MLNCILEDGRGVISVKGEMNEIMMDMTILVKHIYDGLSDDEGKFMFKKFCQELLPELPFQDMDELSDTEKKWKKKAEESKKDMEKTLKEIRDILNNMGIDE